MAEIRGFHAFESSCCSYYSHQRCLAPQNHRQTQSRSASTVQKHRKYRICGQTSIEVPPWEVTMWHWRQSRSCSCAFRFTLDHAGVRFMHPNFGSPDSQTSKSTSTTPRTFQSSGARAPESDLLISRGKKADSGWSKKTAALTQNCG